MTALASKRSVIDPSVICESGAYSATPSSNPPTITRTTCTSSERTS